VDNGVVNYVIDFFGLPFLVGEKKRSPTGIMPSDNKDPFPMQSDEAKAMEASIPATSTSDNSWNAMSTTTTTTALTTNNNIDHQDEEEDGGHGLIAKGKNQNHHNNNNDDDEGDETEKERHQQDDTFLDRPLWESRLSTRGGAPIQKCMLYLMRNLERIVHQLYGDQLSLSEFCRTICLATTLFFMIGSYWVMRSLKDPILSALCGVAVIPKAKMLSVFVVLFVVSIYNKLLDSDMPKHKLFYIFGTFYFVLFIGIALLLMHPVLGLANEVPSPWRIMGWISYCSIESFGSVMVSLFWSFANSNISLETAKASYGVMVATAQIGSILGPTFVKYAAPIYGPAKCYMVGACGILLLQLTMYSYVTLYGVQETKAAAAAALEGKPKVPKKEKAGVLEGLQLFYQYNYVKGIFAISCLFMIAGTIVDFTLKVLAQQYFAEEHPCLPGMSCYNSLDPSHHGTSQEATAAFTSFMGFFGQATNILSFSLSLFGTSAVIRYLGLRLTLLLFPSIILTVIMVVRLNPTLYTVFGAMMVFKACSYALNNPTKEILYQPTSPAVRYKAKSWIDIFGARGSKAVGSIVTNAFSDSATNLVHNGSLVGMCVASFLIWNATFMGRKFDEYTASGYVVGGSTSNVDGGMDDTENLELAMNQNKSTETSCAIFDDDDDNEDSEVGPEEEGQTVITNDSLQFARKTPEVQMV
jgi:ATP:ADP antiporter, AAA family